LKECGFMAWWVGPGATMALDPTAREEEPSPPVGA
jgi:hypothetical protein